jgi:hypothetical protein
MSKLNLSMVRNTPFKPCTFLNSVSETAVQYDDSTDQRMDVAGDPEELLTELAGPVHDSGHWPYSKRIDCSSSRDDYGDEVGSLFQVCQGHRMTVDGSEEIQSLVR